MSSEQPSNYMSDDEITHEFVATIAQREEFAWSIPETSLFLYEHLSGPGMGGCPRLPQRQTPCGSS
ncbi:MAG: hypothetical protein ABI557_05755 [Aureliella sp.]